LAGDRNSTYPKPNKRFTGSSPVLTTKKQFKTKMEELKTERGPMVEPVEPEEYRPSNKQALREYEIGIRFLSRGCVVRVGCKEIAFESAENAMAAINAYVTNPYEEQNAWRKILD